MSVVAVELGDGGFGNALFKYAFARAYANKVGAELHTTPWDGERIFKIESPRIGDQYPVVNDLDFEDWNGRTDIKITGFAQHGKHLIYSREDVRRWFKPQDWVSQLSTAVPEYPVAAHLRWGDFVDQHGFISIPMTSYDRAAEEFGIDPKTIHFISEENPEPIPSKAPADCPTWLPDFIALWKSDILFRGPSTFSWWAGTLGNHSRIFSPNQSGRAWKGGDRGFQECPFVEGNHMPITSWWVGHSELKLRES